MGAFGAAFWSHAVIRTRFFDDDLLVAAGRGVRQVVLLAAGLDCRAYRLAWPPGVRVFELDLPNVLDFKERVLAEQAAVRACERVAVATDLRGNWAAELLGAGFDCLQPTAWLAEGLLVYLEPAQAVQLLTTIDELSASTSRLAFEQETLGTETMRQRAQTISTMQQYTKLWKGGLPDATPGWLTRRGWKSQFHNRADVATALGRGVSGSSNGGFVTATRD